jgi:outer membrane receptor protein involved in Fe transport
VKKARTLCSLAVAVSLITPFSLLAQGVTSAAVAGRITAATRGTVESGVVSLLNTSTGVRMQTSTNNAGRYNFENAAPGGPYTIEVRAIGFQPATKTGVMLTLGQRYVQDFVLEAQPVTLAELEVIAATNPLINSARTGPSQTVSDTAIQRYPLLGRNFTDLLRTSPQVMSGSSVGGQNNRYNTILIDGGVNNDLFGLSSSGTPGGSAGAKPISLEAVREFQILVAPFDVRQGSFSGGLVNGVTKSGSNELHGSAFWYLQRPDLVGRDTAGLLLSTFKIDQRGGTLGGPIIKDRLHFFVSADIQRSNTEFVGLSSTEPATGITTATAQRVQDILRTQYGFDPGGPEAPENLERPDKNFFGKLNYQIGGSSQLEVSHNYVRAHQDAFNRTSRSDATRDGWQLSNSGHRIGSTTNSTRGKFTTLFGSTSLEALVGWQTVRDAREIANQVPLIMVQGDVIGNWLGAGGERFSHGNELDQDNLELTANLTFAVGNNHRVTVGTHNEFFKFRNLFANNRFGTWTFGNADSLELGLARRYEILLESRPGGFTADFAVKQFGLYIQDDWTPTNRLTITGGLRVDAPYSDKPFQNDLPALTDTLGVNTGEFPNGNKLLSPRLGFNWDAFGTGNTILRGGVGLFTGRPPYVWMSNAFTNTGLEQKTLLCTNPANPASARVVPAFTVDVNNQPNACVGGTEPAPPTATVNYFEKDFKFQQALKFAFGVDHRLPWGVVGTFDFLHTRNRNQLYQTDDNVRLGEVNGEGRQLYAAPNAAGTALVRLTRANGVRQVVRHTNKNADRSTLATIQLQKGFADDLSFSVAYTKAKSEDLMTLGSSIATSNLRNTPLDGTLDDRNLRVSALDVPHKITVSGTANLPFGTQLSLIYTARAGTPYAYVSPSDINGDGNTNNDLFYVPATAADISLATPADFDRLNAFIEGESCLREARGRIMERGSCRNPWQKFLDMRLAKSIGTVRGQSLLITADFFNFLNYFDSDWGINRETSFFEQVNLLSMTGYDTRGTASQADDRPIYTVPSVLPFKDRVIVNSSRWRLQLGGKYIW